MDDWEKNAVAVDDDLLKRALDRESFVQSEREQTPDNYALRNLRGVGLGIATDIAAPVARAIGATEFSESARMLDEATNQVLQEKEADNYIPDILERGARSVGRTLPQVAGMGRLGGFKGIAGGIGVQTYDQAYNQALTQGATPELARNFATQQAAIEVGTTTAFQQFAPGIEGVFAKSLGSQSSKAATRGLKNAAIDLAKMSGSELAEEEFIALAQMASEKLSGLDPNAVTAEEVYSVVMETAVPTLMQSGATKGMSAVAEGMERRNRFDQIMQQRAQQQLEGTLPLQEDGIDEVFQDEAELPPIDNILADLLADDVPKTEGELVLALEEAGYDLADPNVAADADAAIEKLLAAGYEFDGDTGEFRKGPSLTGATQSDDAIRQRLLDSGVPPDVVDGLDPEGLATYAAVLDKQEAEAMGIPVPEPTPAPETTPDDVSDVPQTESADSTKGGDQDEEGNQEGRQGGQGLLEPEPTVPDGAETAGATPSSTPLPQDEEQTESTKADEEEYLDGQSTQTEPPTVTSPAPVDAPTETQTDAIGEVLPGNLAAPENIESTGGFQSAENQPAGEGAQTVKPPRRLGGNKKRKPAPEPEAKPEAKLIGKNAQGQDVYEDASGVRSVADGNVRIGEKATLRPIRDPNGAIKFVPEIENREDRFKTVEEMPSAGLSGESTTPTTDSPVVSPDAPAQPETSMGEALGENRPPEARADKPTDEELRQQILDAMMAEDTAETESEPVQRAEKEPEPPRRLGGIKEKIVEKKAESADAYQDAKERLRQKLQGKLLVGIDPEILGAVADVLVQGVRYKAWSFAEIVADLADTFGNQNMPMLRPYIERGWKAVQRVEQVETPDYDAVFNQYQVQEQTDDTGRSEEGSGEPGSERGDATGEGDAGVLEGTPTEDVRAPSEGGDTAGASDAVGGPAGQGDGQADNTGVDEPGRRPEANVGDSADGARKRRPRTSRGANESTETPGDAAPAKQPVKAPTVTTRPNYHMTDPDKIVGGGPKEKFNRNRNAIEIALRVERENREPTQEELDTLAGYMGWGAFGQELFQGSWDSPQPKAGWESQDDWLRTHLGKDEWVSMQESIINAHYTSPPQVTWTWDIIRRLGFQSGRVLEPSIGSGNFYSLMPRDLMEQSYLNGIELDKITAKIAKLLHPQANIQQKGYQESQTPDGFYDVIVGNVPFGDVKVPDRRYNVDFSIHNYFFRKALDQVKPGGIIAFITSSTTMDGKEQAKLLRNQISQQGDLVAAYRFPSGAFSEYAGTKVVADLIIIRKRHPGERPSGASWSAIEDVTTPSGEKVSVNEYWSQHPDHIFGTLDFGRGTTFRRPGMIVHPTGDLNAMMANALAKLPENIIDTKTKFTDAPVRPNDTDSRQNTVVVRDGDVYQVAGEHLVPLIENVKWYRAGSKQDTIDKKRQQIEDLVAIREQLRIVLDKQSRSEDAGAERNAMNEAYDKFVSAHGYVSKSDAAATLRKARDPLGNALTALETLNPDGKTYSKRPIFTKVTTRQKRVTENPSVLDAYAMSRNDSLQLDMDKIAEQAKVTTEQAISELVEAGEVYKTANGNYEPADIFLSGNVLRKIREIKEAMQQGVDGLEKSLSELDKIKPEAIPFTDIETRLGATWIPSGDYKQFLSDLLNEPVERFTVERFPGRWKIRFATGVNDKPEATTMHGHPAVPFSRMVMAAMNNGTVQVYDKDDEGNKILNETATKEANAKVDELRGKFSDWIWATPDRIVRLSEGYNETFNAHISPTFDNVPLTFEGLALQRGDDPFSLRKHQESAVWRGIVTGKGIYAHEVGTGKTLTMGALAMESKRLGLATKPILFAHNANSMSVKNEIEAAYPGSRILYVDNLSAENRDQTLAQIATDDWDLVVVPHSLIDRFQLKPETLQKLLQEEMDSLEANAREAFAESESQFKGSMPENLDNLTEDDLKDLKEPTAKELVKERMRLRARIIKAQQALASGDNVFFEDMGVDMMMIDESHIFKKQALSSKQRIKGLNKTGSERGTAMLVMADYIRSINNGRGVHAFTGTPITNTLNEIYNMQRLVMGEEMAEAGVKDWDGWFNAFANSESNVELSSGGTWETFDRLVSFVNLPELRKMVGRYMDTVFADDMPEFIVRESREGRTENPIGRPFKQVHNEIVEMNESQRVYSEALKQRYIEFRDAPKKEKRQMMLSGGEHNPLVIEGEGVKLALDPRLVGLKVDPKDPSLKINKMLRNAMQHYNEHPKSTQMIFMETGHNDTVTRTRTELDGSKTKSTHKVFSVANEIKRRLIEEGVPEDQIVLFANLTDKAKRAEAAERMQRGEIRFAIGSTATMGTGVNAQNEMVAMHHMDAPWMPGELEQRNGRGHRQGNRWNTVHEYRYLTEGPQDGRRWQVLLTKDRFIQKFIRSEGKERVMEMDTIDLSDEGESSDMEKSFSAAAGDPRIMLRTKLEGDIRKLEESKDRHSRNIQYSLSRARDLEQSIADVKALNANRMADYETFMSTDGEPFSITIEGLEGGPKTYADRESAAEALSQLNMDRFVIQGRRAGNRRGFVEVGAYRGLKLFINGGTLYVNGKTNHDINKFSLASIEGTMRAIPGLVERSVKNIESEQTFIEQARSMVGAAFPKEAILQTKRAKLAALVKEMSDNPTASPSWLRLGAPVGSAVYWNGQAYDVSGHRGEDTILSDKPDGDGFIEIPASEATSEDGSPIFVHLWKGSGISRGSSRDPRQSRGTRLGRSARRGTRVDRGARPSEFNPSRRLGSQRASNANLKQNVDKDAKVRFDTQTPGAPVRSSSDDQAGIAAADVVRTLSRIFGTTTRIGSIRGRALGTYLGLSSRQNVPRTVRLAEQAATSVAVQIHEIGHHIDRLHNIVSNNPDARAIIKGAVHRVKREELKSLDYSSEGRPEEGFAEWVRIYLTEPETKDAQGKPVTGPMAKAPEFTKWMLNEYAKENPELFRQLAEAKKFVDAYADQSLFRRLRAQIGNSPGDDLEFAERMKKRMRDSLKSFRTMTLDRHDGWNEIDKAYREAGGQGPLGRDVVNVYEYSASVHAERALQDGVHNIGTGAVIGSRKGFWSRVSGLLKSDQELADAEVFALARHTLWAEQNKPGYFTGMAPDDARKLLERIKNDDQDQYDRFEKIAIAISDVAHDLLKMRVVAGTFPRDDYNKIISIYGDNYFPMFRAMDGQRAIKGNGSGYLNVPIGVPGRSKRGSGRPVVSPFESIHKMAHDYYSVAARGRVQDHLRSMIDPRFGGVEGMGWVGTPIDPKKKKSSVTVVRILDQLVSRGLIEKEDAAAAVTAGQILGTIDGVPSPDQEQEFADRHNIDVNDGQAMYDAAMTEPSVAGVLSQWDSAYEAEPGKMIAISYDRQGNPYLHEYDAEIYNMLTNLSPPHLALSSKLVSKMGRAFKSAAVSANATFALLNLFRDYVTYQGRAKNVKGLKALTEPIKQLVRFANYKRRSMLGRSRDKLASDLLLFDSAGGSTFSRAGMDASSRKREVRRLLSKSKLGRLGFTSKHPRDILSGVGNMAANIRDAIENVISISDAPPRLSEMNAVIRSHGFTPLTGGKFRNDVTGNVRDGLPEDVMIEAMMAAANATVNFKKGGTLTKAIDVYVPFAMATLNANVTFAKQVANLRHFGQNTPEGRLANRYAVYLASTVAMAAIYYALRRDEDDYKNAEDWELNKYWTFGWNGVTYVRVPKPQDEAIVSNLVESMMGMMFGDVDTRDMLGVVTDDVIGRIPTGGGPVKGAFEVAINYDFYRGRSIEPEFVQDFSTRNQFTNDTRYLSILMGKVTSNLGVSPMQIEHLINATTANQYEKMHRLFEGWNSGSLSIQNIPGARAFYVNRHASRPISDFYDRLGELKTAIADSTKDDTSDDPRIVEAKAEAAKLDAYRQVMAAVTEAQRTEPGDKYKYVPYIVGLAREALGYEAVDSSPSPLAMAPETLPEGINKAIAEFAQKSTDRTVLMLGVPEKVPKDEEGQKTFSEVRRVFRDRVDAKLSFLEEHQNDPAFSSRIRSMVRSKQFAEAMKREPSRGELTPAEYREDLKRHREQRARIMAIARAQMQSGIGASNRRLVSATP